MNKESDWVVLGRLGRPQGLKGLIRVISFTEPESSILDYQPWSIQQKDAWRALSLKTIQVQTNAILVKVAGYTEREDVAQLTNQNIGVLRTQLPQLPNGDYYWHELKQMHVVNQDGITLGQVTDILPTGANDVLVVCGKKRYLIPYILGIYVVSVDPAQRLITVDWDESF